METLQSHLLKALFVLAICLNMSADLFAQKVQRFDSLYTSESGITGNATFNFTLEKNQIVKTGEFNFIAEVIDQECATHKVLENWAGEYENDLKNGKWKYIIKEFDVKISSISEDELVYNVFLKESNYTVNYTKGKLDDRFSFERTLIVNGEKDKTLEKLDLTFSDHRVNGEVNYLRNEYGDHIEISGKAFDGLMEGEWIFDNKEAKSKEKRVYRKGVLLSLLQLYEDDTVTFHDYPISEPMRNTLNGQNQDFELANKPLSLIFSDGYPRNCVYVEEQKQNNQYLNYLLELVFHFEPNKKTDFGLVLGTNRGYYPLSNEEKDLLKSWPEIEFNFRRTIQHANDLLFKNIRYKEDSLLRVLTSWKNQQEYLLGYIHPWNEILYKDQLEFYNRKGLLVDYAHEILDKDSIRSDEQLYVFDYTPDGVQPDNFLAYLVTSFKTRNDVADSLISEVDKRLGKLYLADEVAIMNIEIIRAKTQNDSIFNSGDYHSDIAPYAKQIGNYYLTDYFDEQYEYFLNEKSISIQKETGNKLLQNVNLLYDVHMEFQMISERRALLDSLYTEYSFDPFTYSDRVPVRIKKKLYEIVANDMLFKMLDKIEPIEYRPAQVLQTLRRISSLQKRLIFLKDKDTRKIERKLRSNKSLNERLEILKID